MLRYFIHGNCGTGLNVSSVCSRSANYYNSIVIFQSGTTGPAKGVMLSHDNLVFTAKAINVLVNFREKCERILTYLPLSHIAEQVSRKNTECSNPVD